MTMSRTEATSLVRQVSIDAPAATVFKYLTDPSLITTWKGRNAVFEPFEGGEYRVEISDTIVAGGKVIAVEPNHRVVYSFGWEGDENPVTVGSSKVEITLEETDGTTVVTLSHTEIAGQVMEHGGGWEHYLARLAIAVVGGDPGPDPIANPPTDA